MSLMMAEKLDDEYSKVSKELSWAMLVKNSHLFCHPLLTTPFCSSLFSPSPLLSAQGCDEFTDLGLSHAIIGTSLKIRLLLYTRDNVTCGTLMSHTNLHAHPQFNLSRPTTFIIHGYRPTGSPPMWLQNITEMVLAREDVNIIVVDWNYGAANVNYFKAVENTHKAADNLTAFIKKMQVGDVSNTSLWPPLLFLDRNSILTVLCVTMLMTDLFRNTAPLWAPSTWSESASVLIYQAL